jgi:hypothetical protein
MKLADIVDLETSSCFIDVRREGLAAALGHDLRIEVTRHALNAEDGETVAAEFDATSLRVVGALDSEGRLKPGDLSAKDRATIEASIRDKVLESKRHPTVRFRAGRVTEQPGGYVVEGELELHGVRKAPARRGHRARWPPGRPDDAAPASLGHHPLPRHAGRPARAGRRAGRGQRRAARVGRTRAAPRPGSEAGIWAARSDLAEAFGGDGGVRRLGAVGDRGLRPLFGAGVSSAFGLASHAASLGGGGGGAASSGRLGTPLAFRRGESARPAASPHTSLRCVFACGPAARKEADRGSTPRMNELRPPGAGGGGGELPAVGDWGLRLLFGAGNQLGLRPRLTLRAALRVRMRACGP